MVRVNLYDNYEANMPGEDGNEKVVYTNQRDAHSFAIDLTPDFLSSFDMRTCDGGKLSCADATGSEVVKDNKEEVTYDPIDSDGVGQVWSNFLEGTSLHGCKNVKEKGWLTRMIWSLAILSMTAALVIALVSLVVRYRSHPFVTAWSFKREASVLAPGLTLCIPTRFHKSKLNGSREAYQMLVYDRIDQGGFIGVPTGTEVKTEWVNELMGISLNRARSEIGVTAKDIITSGTIWQQQNYFDVSRKVIQIDIGDGTCWQMNYFAKVSTKDEFMSPGQVGSDTEEEFRNVEDVHENSINAKIDNNGFNNDNHTSSVHDALDENAEDFTIEGWASEVSSSDGRSPDHLTSNQWTSTVSFLLNDIATSYLETTRVLGEEPLTVDTLNNPFDEARPTTETPISFTTSSGISETDENKNPDVEIDETKAKLKGEALGNGDLLLRLNMDDSILLSINLNQYDWLGDVHFGGLRLYLHDQNGIHWTKKPILLRPGTYNEVNFRHVRYKFLPLPFKSFAVSQGQIVGQSDFTDEQSGLGCVDVKSPEFENPMFSRPAEHYTAEGCMLELATNVTVDKCGCVARMVDVKLYGVDQCSVLVLYTCFYHTLWQEYFRLGRLMANSGEDETNTTGGFRCPQECEISHYKTYISSGDYPSAANLQRMTEYNPLIEKLIRDNHLIIAVKPEGPLSETIEHVPELTLLGVVGSIGGYMGLCMGASLLSLTELGQAGITCVCVILRKLVESVGGRRKD